VLKPLRDIGIFTRQHQGVPEFPLRLLAVRKDPGMHIVYFAHDWLLSGASMCLLDLVRGLAGRGAVINVVVPGEGNLKETLQQNGIGTHVIDRRLVMELAWNWTIPGCGSDDLSTGIRNGIHLAVNSLVPMLREWQPDMILSQTVTLPWGAVCARILGIPFACSMREYGDLDHGLQFPLGMRACMEALYKDSDMAFCITRDVARHLFGEDPDKKVEVIYINLHMDGIDRLVDVPVANGLKLADNEVPRIGLLATYKEQKGHEDLVRAAIALMEEGLVFRCVMAGWIADGDYYLRLREMADASGHGSNFEFLTHTESPYLLLDELDLVISCSQIEGLGRTLIEAIQLGKPIIYADTGGPAEIYTHGEHGLSYRHGNWKELAERIKDTLQDKDAAQRRVSAARLLIAARLNEDQYAGKVWALIRKAAAVDVSRKPAATLQLMADAFRLEIAPEQMRPRLFYSSIPNDFHDVQSLHAGPIPFGPFDLDFTFSGDGIEYFSLLITNRHPIELVIHRFLTDADGPEADGTEPVDCWSNGDPVGQFSWKYLRTDPALVFRMPMAIGRLRLIGHVRLLSRADVLYELGQQVEALRQDNLELRSDHQREVSAWEAGMAEKTRTIVHMEEVVAEKTRIIVHMEEVLSQKSLAIENWEATHARDARRIGELEWHLQKREQELEKTKWRLDDITGTYAWKFSAPLRRLEKFILRTFGKSGRRK
jgi:glycosyltransferase involved in cell wall biosynthesis